MSALSPDETALCEVNPIEDGLDAFCNRFHAKYPSNDLDWQKTVRSDEDTVKLLIGSLLTLPAAALLPSRHSTGKLDLDLATIVFPLVGRGMNVEKTAVLLERVVKPESNHNIWCAVYDLVASVIPATPPPRVSVLKHDTPVRANSGTSFTTSQIHELIDPYLRAELRDTVWKNVTGFHAYFPGLDRAHWNCAIECERNCSDTCKARWDWTGKPKKIVTSLKKFYGWPHSISESKAVGWFKKVNKKLTSTGPAGPVRFYASGTKALKHSNCQRKCDIFLSKITDDEYSWRDVLVCGEFKTSEKADCTPDIVVQLAGYAREVFGAQVGRRFLHAFTICKDIMRCYLFDRAGVTISEGFEINKNGKTRELFSRIILSYGAMGPAQFGLDTNYTSENGDPFFPTSRQPHPTFLTIEGRRFRILRKLFYQPAIVSRGTLCWLAKDENMGKECVVKDAWRSKYRQSEGELMTTAKEKDVWGAIDCIYHDATIDGVPDEIHSHIRKNLIYELIDPVIIRERPIDDKFTLQAGNTETQRMSALKLPGPAVKNSTDAKRRLPGQGGLSSSSKRLKVHNDNVSTEEKDGDRVHAYLVMYTVGKRIENFTSVKHLLEVFRDATKCHQSLVEEGKILHRDVSNNNIMISNCPASNDPKGFLIDLDLSKSLDLPHQQCKARHRTGTMEFMAIEVLEGEVSHTWRHDLESFFYVFIWICVLYEGQGSQRRQKPVPNVLQAWASKSAADAKRALVAFSEKYESLLDSFSPDFKMLRGMMREWRTLLFPLVPLGDRQMGTPADHRPLYEAIVSMLDRQIANL